MLAMSDSQAEPERPEAPDWEAFYANYRKPGYIHGFEIGPKLGGGMFGVVFKARKESIGKSYAIKFLRVEDPGVRDQVLREIDTVSLFAQVDHPNLVSIEDKGVVDGIPYIVMGYAGEETLKDRFESGPLAEDEALQLFVQIARGVSALHEHSLVHFDLKPANVFLKGDIARVGDYGLSKLITETAMSLSTGRGTPYYMAPEMLRRKGDHRSDIYSLGIMLFEALAGDVPFKGDSEWEVLKGHEEKPVVFPERIPQRYRALIQKALAKDPEARFDSVADMLHALRAPASLGESIVFDLPPKQAAGPTPVVHAFAAVGAQAEAATRDAMRVADEAVAHARQQARRFEDSHTGDESSWWPWLLLGLAFVFWGKNTVSWAGVFIAIAIYLIISNAVKRARRRGRPHSAGFALFTVLALGLVTMGGCLYMFAAQEASYEEGGVTISSPAAPTITRRAQASISFPNEQVRIAHILQSRTPNYMAIRGATTSTLEQLKAELPALMRDAEKRPDRRLVARYRQSWNAVKREQARRVRENLNGTRRKDSRMDSRTEARSNR